MAGPFTGVVTPASQSILSSGNPVQNSVVSGTVGSGAVAGQLGGGRFNIASGTIGSNDIGSGQITRYHLNSGCLIEQVIAGTSLSGLLAVAIASGVPYSGASFLVYPAERASGLRLPAKGVHVGDVASGQVTRMITRGIVTTANSGVCPSGFTGLYLYVGSGGLLVNLSGFYAGTSSGPGPNPSVALVSGTLVQRIGIAVSGGVYVDPEECPNSGLLSGLLMAY